jgi:hypothetical protein
MHSAMLDIRSYPPGQARVPLSAMRVPADSPIGTLKKKSLQAHSAPGRATPVESDANAVSAASPGVPAEERRCNSSGVSGRIWAASSAQRLSASVSCWTRISRLLFSSSSTWTSATHGPQSSRARAAASAVPIKSAATPRMHCLTTRVAFVCCQVAPGQLVTPPDRCTQRLGISGMGPCQDGPTNRKNFTKIFTLKLDFKMYLYSSVLSVVQRSRRFAGHARNLELLGYAIE